MKPKEIKLNEEFIISNFVFIADIQDSKLKFKFVRKHDGKAKGFVIPTQHEVMEYFFQKGYESLTGATAWDYYNELSWKDSNGKEIKNWRAKMLSVWMKPENKRKLETIVSPQLIL